MNNPYTIAINPTTKIHAKGREYTAETQVPSMEALIQNALLPRDARGSMQEAFEQPEAFAQKTAILTKEIWDRNLRVDDLMQSVYSAPTDDEKATMLAAIMEASFGEGFKEGERRGARGIDVGHSLTNPFAMAIEGVEGAFDKVFNLNPDITRVERFGRRVGKTAGLESQYSMGQKIASDAIGASPFLLAIIASKGLALGASSAGASAGLAKTASIASKIAGYSIKSGIARSAISEFGDPTRSLGESMLKGTVAGVHTWSQMTIPTALTAGSGYIKSMLIDATVDLVGESINQYIQTGQAPTLEALGRSQIMNAVFFHLSMGGSRIERSKYIKGLDGSLDILKGNKWTEEQKQSLVQRNLERGTAIVLDPNIPVQMKVGTVKAMTKFFGDDSVKGIYRTADAKTTLVQAQKALEAQKNFLVKAQEELQKFIKTGNINNEELLIKAKNVIDETQQRITDLETARGATYSEDFFTSLRDGTMARQADMAGGRLRRVGDALKATDSVGKKFEDIAPAKQTDEIVTRLTTLRGNVDKTLEDAGKKAREIEETTAKTQAIETEKSRVFKEALKDLKKTDDNRIGRLVDGLVDKTKDTDNAMNREDALRYILARQKEIFKDVSSEAQMKMFKKEESLNKIKDNYNKMAEENKSNNRIDKIEIVKADDMPGKFGETKISEDGTITVRLREDIDMNTMLHEMGHVFNKLVGSVNGKLYDKAMKLVESEGKQYIEEAREIYKGQDVDDAFIKEEALARAIADKGAKLVQNKNIFKTFVEKFNEIVSKILGISENDLDNMTLEEYAEETVRAMFADALREPKKVEPVKTEPVKTEVKPETEKEKIVKKPTVKKKIVTTKDSPKSETKMGQDKTKTQVVAKKQDKSPKIKTAKTDKNFAKDVAEEKTTKIYDKVDIKPEPDATDKDKKMIYTINAIGSQDAQRIIKAVRDLTPAEKTTIQKVVQGASKLMNSKDMSMFNRWFQTIWHFVDAHKDNKFVRLVYDASTKATEQYRSLIRGGQDVNKLYLDTLRNKSAEEAEEYKRAVDYYLWLYGQKSRHEEMKVSMIGQKKQVDEDFFISSKYADYYANKKDGIKMTREVYDTVNKFFEATKGIAEENNAISIKNFAIKVGDAMAEYIKIGAEKKMVEREVSKSDIEKAITESFSKTQLTKGISKKELRDAIDKIALEIAEKAGAFDESGYATDLAKNIKSKEWIFDTFLMDNGRYIPQQRQRGEYILEVTTMVDGKTKKLFTRPFETQEEAEAFRDARLKNSPKYKDMDMTIKKSEGLEQGLDYIKDFLVMGIDEKKFVSRKLEEYLKGNKVINREELFKVWAQAEKEYMTRHQNRYILHREDYVGYEVDDMFRIFTEYHHKMAGYIANKHKLTELRSGAFFDEEVAKGWSSLGDREKRYMTDYIRSMIKSESDLDAQRIVGGLQNVLYLSYISGKASTALAQSMQAFANFPVVLASNKIFKANHAQALGLVSKSMKDVMGFTKDNMKSGHGISDAYKNLSKDEIDFLAELAYAGKLNPGLDRMMYSSESFGGAVSRLLSIPIEYVDSMARTATVLTAYRQLKKTNPGMSKDEMKPHIEKVLQDSNPVMGREGHMPLAWNNPLVRLMATFTTYSMHQVQFMWKYMGKGLVTHGVNKGEIEAIQSMQNLMYYTIASVLAGGTSAIPFLSSLSETPILSTVMPEQWKENEKKLRRVMGFTPKESVHGRLTQRVLNHGLLGLTGVSMSRQLTFGANSIFNPFSTNNALFSFIRGTDRGLRLMTDGKVMEALQTLPIPVVRRLAQGIKGFQGATFRDKKIMVINPNTGKLEAVDYNVGGLLAKLLGFNIVSEEDAKAIIDLDNFYNRNATKNRNRYIQLIQDGKDPTGALKEYIKYYGKSQPRRTQTDREHIYIF